MKRLSTVQRMVLTFMLDQGKQGKPTIIVSGHKKTRVGYFPALQAEGVATCFTSLFFLRYNGLIEPVGAAPPSGVTTAPKQWERRTRG